LLPDNEIIKLLISDPEKGMGLLMDQYMGFVYTIAYGKLYSVCGRQDIEECVSDVFYELFRTRGSIDLEKGSIKAYLAVISKRKAILAFRKHSKEKGIATFDEFEDAALPSMFSVEETVAGREAGSILIDEIKALGEPDSQIMIRKYYFGQKTKVIASALGLKENTVDKKVSRALTKLKQALGGAV
jgi:RNA polymerase sigma factor, sigma-70 family